MTDPRREVALGALVFHGCLAFVALAEAAMLAWLIWMLLWYRGIWARLGDTGGDPVMVKGFESAIVFAAIAAALVLVVAGYHFCCALAHRREARP